MYYGLSGQLCRTVALSFGSSTASNAMGDILRLRSYAQMRGIDAAWIIAAMKNHHAFWYWTYEMLINQPVG